MRAPLVAALVLAARAALAADPTADPTTYQAALAALKPGDTLHLAAGSYPGLAIGGVNGTAGAWITITGPAAGGAVIAAPAGGCCNTVELTNASYLALTALTIDSGHQDGVFGVSANGGTGNLVHDIRIEGCSLVGQDASQQTDGISTKTPTWGWVIRANRVSGAGTGLYLGNSDGSDPFIGGLIEGNLIEDTIGYNIEIKFQNPRPNVAGMPTAPTTTILRDNVFIKNDQPSPDGDRPNLLVGGFPASGDGAMDRYEIYRNLFFHNPRESLLQASGRVTIHDNLFVDVAGTAVLLQDHDLPLEQAFVYNNTVYSAGRGIAFGNAAPMGDGVVGNLVFAATPISGPIASQSDNLVDAVANAGGYVDKPGIALGAFDLYPLAGKCEGTMLALAPFAGDTDYARDFNGASKGGFTFRGAYAGAGANPGWMPQEGEKPLPGAAPLPDGGAAQDLAMPRTDGGSGGGSDLASGDGAGVGGTSGGCGCVLGGRTPRGATIALLLVLALARRRIRRR